MGLLHRLAKRKQEMADFQTECAQLPLSRSCVVDDANCTPDTAPDQVSSYCEGEVAIETSGKSVVTTAAVVSDESAMVVSPNQKARDHLPTESFNSSKDDVSTQDEDQVASSSAKQHEEPILETSRSTPLAVGLLANIATRKIGKENLCRPKKVGKENQFRPNKIEYDVGHIASKLIGAYPADQAPRRLRTPLASIDTNGLRC
jgi:hypothetical protein